MKEKHGNVFSSLSLSPKPLRHHGLLSFFPSYLLLLKIAPNGCPSVRPFSCLPSSVAFHFSVCLCPLLSRSFLMPFDATHAAGWLAFRCGMPHSWHASTNCTQSHCLSTWLPVLPVGLGRLLGFWGQDSQQQDWLSRPSRVQADATEISFRGTTSSSLHLTRLPLHTDGPRDTGRVCRAGSPSWFMHGGLPHIGSL